MKKIGIVNDHSFLVEMSEVEYSHILRIAGVSVFMSTNCDIDQDMSLILGKLSKTQLGRIVELLRRIAELLRRIADDVEKEDAPAPGWRPIL